MTDGTPPKDHNQEPDKELGQIFDLDRQQLTRQLVNQIEQAMRDVQTAQDDLKEIVASAKEAQFPRRDIAAMKEIAKLRLKDQGGAAREKLEALQRVGHAVGFDLFDWASERA